MIFMSLRPVNPLFGPRAGQSMIEYIIVVLMVAVAALMVIGVFGTNVRNLYSPANASLQEGRVINTYSIQDHAKGNVSINNLQGR